MSAIARYLQLHGKNVTGSDLTATDITDALQKEGARVFIGNDPENVTEQTECVIYTPAISGNDPELLRAKKMGLPTLTYAEMLGQISAGMKTIAVSGTHGKTTTTALTDAALRAADVSPTTIIGSLISQNKTNYIAGQSDIVIVEACEYKKSFLNLNPYILIITNIEADHLDFYKDLQDIKDAFMELADKIPDNGKIICDFEDENLSEIISKHQKKVINYRDFINRLPPLKVFGDHNKKNAAAALAVANILAVDLEKAKEGLENFVGTWRRMEFRGKNENGALIYDDYAHHPTELESTLAALKEHYSNKQINIFFQPHLYSRTKLLFDDFVKVLSLADNLYILPIYAAREPIDPSISSEMLVDKIDGATFVSSFEEAKKIISKKRADNIVATVGAGDVYQILEG